MTSKLTGSSKAIPTVRSTAARVAKKLPATTTQTKDILKKSIVAETDQEIESTLPPVATDSPVHVITDTPNFVHVDIPSFVLEFQQQFRDLNHRLATQDSRLQQLESLVQENQRLKDDLAAAQAEIALLKALTSSSSLPANDAASSGMDVDILGILVFLLVSMLMLPLVLLLPLPKLSNMVRLRNLLLLALLPRNRLSSALLLHLLKRKSRLLPVSFVLLKVLKAMNTCILLGLVTCLVPTFVATCPVLELTVAVFLMSLFLLVPFLVYLCTCNTSLLSSKP